MAIRTVLLRDFLEAGWQRVAKILYEAVMFWRVVETTEAAVEALRLEMVSMKSATSKLLRKVGKAKARLGDVMVRGIV